MTEKVECAICGRAIAGRIPKGGDGSMLVPHRHIDPKWGHSCSGRFFEGEWFLNTAHGVPYFQSILGQKPLNLNLVSNILIEAILDVEGIASIEESIIDYEEVERKIKFEFIAKTISGTSINDTILI